MTERIALWLALILFALIAGDLIFDEGDAILFLARRLAGLVEYLIFWR